MANGDYKDQHDVDENCPFKVYYLPNDKAPYDMKYQENGRFQESFQTGFFDEAAKSTSEISMREMANLPKMDIKW